MKRPEIIRRHYKNLEDKGHGKYIGEEYWYKGEPYTGFVIFEYHDNGSVLLEQEHVNGQTMGWEIEYFSNGMIKEETLMYGATSVVFREYSEQDELITEGWVSQREYYNIVAKETGMEPI